MCTESVADVTYLVEAAGPGIRMIAENAPAGGDLSASAAFWYRFGGLVTQRLSDVEIRALADAFGTQIRARQLLVRAGFPRARVPELVGMPYDYWWEISGQLENGLLVEGRARLLAAAAEEFPASEVFAIHRGLPAALDRRIPVALDVDAPRDILPAARERGWSAAGLPEPVSLFFLDARQYSRRGMLGQLDWRAALRELVAAAIAGLRLPAESIRLLQDQGDGFLGAVAASVAKVTLASDFVRELQIAQRSYNNGRDAGSRLRLRMSLHHGEVIIDGAGASGDAVVVAARLIDAPQVRGMLERYPDADLVLALSPEYYRDTAAERLRDLDPAKFRKIDVSVGDKYTGTAWVTLPGHPANPPRGDDPAAAPPPAVNVPAGAEASLPGAATLLTSTLPSGLPSEPRGDLALTAEPRGIPEGETAPVAADDAGAATTPASSGAGALGLPGEDDTRGRSGVLRGRRKRSGSPPPFPGQRG
ncbi:effector-associated domain EAD1-containing protein [Frankia sp. AiPs1]|uniref:effector-associated domain EAD1-containing protein n=1 Tax=Frankia sp. AiPs1 TaxID=573493 RepID=UPI0020433FBC|nr:effector-associated domain EAD1-containing protein [Frankia sp. AiPs1]MCM3924234.1 effector-associated domain EAD1-containing protein [Frankia sp. AiPs1]